MRLTWTVFALAGNEFRLRVCHRKDGRLRFLSHLELCRALERGIRRASLPFAITRGFNPRMKVAFSSALPVGTAAAREYYDLWMTHFVQPADALDALRCSSPAEMSPLEAAYVPVGAPSLASTATLAEYTVTMTEGVDEEELQGALVDVIARGELVVERKGKRKVFELTTCLPKEPTVGSYEGRAVVGMTVRTGQSGSMRPESLISAALAQRRITGAIELVTRTDVLLEEGGAVRRPL